MTAWEAPEKSTGGLGETGLWDRRGGRGYGQPTQQSGPLLLHLSTERKMPVHHLMVGTWTPPGAIFTFAFDDEELTLELVKRTAIPEDEPISWMTFDVSRRPSRDPSRVQSLARCQLLYSMPRRTSTARP